MTTYAPGYQPTAADLEWEQRMMGGGGGLQGSGASGGTGYWGANGTNPVNPAANTGVNSFNSGGGTAGALSLQDAIAQGMNYGQWAEAIGLGQNEVQPASSAPTDMWESFRQNSVNSFNTSLANRPDLQAAGVQQMNFTPGNYSGMEEALTNRYGSHTTTDANGNTQQLAYRPGGLGGGSAGGGAGGGMGNPPAASSGGGYGLGSNPYQGAQADALAAQQQQFLNKNLAGIRSNSVGVGGLGGSRQGVAQGEAIGAASTGLSGALANLYGANYNADQNRDLSRYGMDQNFFLGNRSADQGDFRNGLAAVGLANDGDWSGLNNANNIYSPWSGFGQSTNNTSSGGGTLGGLGGALAGFGFAGQNGWWK